MAKIRKSSVVITVVSILLLAGTAALVWWKFRKQKDDGNSIIPNLVSGFQGYSAEQFPLKKGMMGSKVRAMQLALVKLGCSVGGYGADGKFGSDTLTGVRSYYNNPSKTEISHTEWLVLTGKAKIDINNV